MVSTINWEQLKILIVEDSRTQALLLEESLKEKGPRVLIATNGLEGIEMIKQHQPTLVISDIEMPKMNGYELCHQVKSDPNLKAIPIILLTALSDPLDVIKGIECGADYFLTKPCKIDLLFSYIEDVLENRLIVNEQNLTASSPLEFSFRGQRYKIPSNPMQITDLLLSTYSSAIEKNQELEQANRQLSVAHQELRKKNEELSQLNNQKNQLLGMAAHDLRNPLGIILGYTNLLLNSVSENFDEKALLKLNHIKKSSSFMLNLINDLLDISAIESGKVHLNLSKQNLVKLINDNVVLNQSFSEKKQIKIIFSQQDPIPEIICDSQKIEQVLNNLLTNAIKFSNPNTTIEVNLVSKDNEVILSVKDQGVGIPTEEQSRLFQSFTKTSAKTTAGEPSTGLGLAIVKKIVLEHKGKIWVQSEVGKGSTFFVALPVDPSKE